MAVESAVKVPLQVCHALSQPSELALHRGAALVASVRAVLHLIQPGPGGRQGRGRPLHRGRQALHRGVQALLHLEMLLVRLPEGRQLLGETLLRLEEVLNFLCVPVRKSHQRVIEAVDALLDGGHVPVAHALQVHLQLGAALVQLVGLLHALGRLLLEQLPDHLEAPLHLVLQCLVVLLCNRRNACHEVGELAVQGVCELVQLLRLRVAARRVLAGGLAPQPPHGQAPVLRDRGARALSKGGAHAGRAHGHLLLSRTAMVVAVGCRELSGAG
mmetsp:Transcript_70630/g.195189  ORF Transcript_70630/g.195189 Transcript_70630/m.195189 type:complete len:272 (-) Transcript_70630:38-853(-)